MMVLDVDTTPVPRPGASSEPGHGGGPAPRHRPPAPKGTAHLVWELALALAGVALFCLTWWGTTRYPEAGLGIAQPLPFSHQIHAGVKRISCLVCHNTAQASAKAGIPPLETCMLCHSRLIITFPDIRTLREHYYEGRPVRWNRVNYLPDFVKFNHSVHLARSVDCGHCHGEVRKMDRIIPPQLMEMGFCIECHKHYNATHDCFGCHR